MIHDIYIYGYKVPLGTALPSMSQCRPSFEGSKPIEEATCADHVDHLVVS